MKALCYVCVFELTPEAECTNLFGAEEITFLSREKYDNGMFKI